MKIDREALLIIVLSILVTSISIIMNMPSTTPYSPYNTYGDGYSELLSIADRAIVVKGIKNIENNSVVVLPIARGMDRARYEWIKDVLNRGNIVVILDEVGYVNEFMDFIGIRARIENTKILDEVNKLNSRVYPLIALEIKINDSVYRYKVAMYRPSHIVIDNSTSIFSKGTTSAYAYADIDSNNYYSLGEEMGVYVTICSFKVGKGELWLISDLDLFSNKMIDIENVDNRKFLETLVKFKMMYIVIDYLELSSIDIIKYGYNAIIPLNLPKKHISIGLSIYVLLLSILVVMRYAERRG